MTSLVLEPADGQPLAAALPGQFIVLRLRPASAPALLRSYSLSGEPSDARYRVSVKREAHGAAGAYIDDELQVGDIVDASAPRGSFTLRPGDGPVVLLSAGIGATPVLAMLHALAAEASPREIWWLHGARNGGEHPFAAEARALLKPLPTATATSATARQIPRTGPLSISTLPGAWTCARFEELGVPRDADFYICGPAAFMSDLTAGLSALGRRARPHSHRDFRRRPVDDARHRRLRRASRRICRRAPRRGPAGILRAQRPQRPLGSRLPEPARTCRGVRCAGAMVVPDRGLPHLRDRADRRRGQLPAGPGRAAGGRQCADLLRATRRATS